MADATVKTQLPAKSEAGTLGGPTTEAGKAPSGPGGLLDSQRAAGNQATQEAVAAAQPPEPTGLKGQLVRAAIDVVISQLPGGPTLRVAAAAVHGFVSTLAHEVSLTDLAAGVKELATPRNLLDFTLAYQAGSVLGFISPVTDLFGIVVLAEQLNKMADDLGRAVWEHPEDLIAKARALGNDFRTFLKDTGKNLSALELLKHAVELPDKVMRGLEVKAGEIGSHAAHAVILHFSGKEEEQPARPAEPPAGYAGRLEQWAVETRKKLTNTQWSRLGYNIGYDVGAVVSNTLLFVFSFGAGEAVAAVGAELGKLGGLLARVGNVAEKVGAGIKVIEDLIAALLSKPMQWLEPVLKPFFELLERFKTFLRELLGFVDKKAAKTAVTTLEKHAAETAAPDPPHAPKPTAPEPHPAPKPTTPEPHPTAAPEPRPAPKPPAAEPPVAHTAPPPKSAMGPKKGPSTKKSTSTPKKTPTKTTPKKTSPKKKTAPAPKTTAPPKKKAASPKKVAGTSPTKTATSPKKKATSAKKTAGAPQKTSAPPKKKPAATSSGGAHPQPVIERVGADDGRHSRVDPDARFFNGQNPPHHHVTDQHDRPLMAEGWLRASKAPRHSDQRWGAEQMMGKLSGTEQGHLLASRFGGDGRIFNLSPLPRSLNQGEIKALEDALAQEMKSGRRFYVQAYNDYAGVGRVPSAVEYRVFVDDGGTPRQIFEMTIYASH
ncbi:DNA/RNA non-specific endonuclease [Streptomyces sp. NPDC001137]|uniref:DNA/RNA non-specific endonuclease n=1 Tax=Streptomyces sp. NPDC001137 TaxID=3154378 RepID=UPI003332B429